MKGIIFTEFLDFIEARSGYGTVDEILEKVAPVSGGAYTAVGNYEFSELAALTTELSKVYGQPVPVLMREFGRYLFSRYVTIYPLFFQGIDDPFQFLEMIEHRIHTEVLKLYPDAKLPSLKAERIGPDCMTMYYRSSRPLGEMCLGVIEGCGEYFNVQLDIQATSATEGLDIVIRRIGVSTGGQPVKLHAEVVP